MAEKILFGAHGSILQVFAELDRRLRSRGTIKQSAYWISDSQYYFANRARFPVLNDSAVEQLFEWDFTGSDAVRVTTASRRDELDAQYGACELWNAVIADRRLIYGRLSKTRQSYQGHFDHQALCNIVYGTLDALDRLIERLRPDAIVTFVPATYGDYLLAVAAKARAIRYLQLRSTKIKNYVLFADSLDAQVSSVAQRYRRNFAAGSGYRCEKPAADFIAGAAGKPVDYEGTIARERPALARRLKEAATRFAGALHSSFKPLNQEVACDNHVPPPITTWLHSTLLQSTHRRAAMRRMQPRMLTLDEAAGTPYLFYPLHSEPEIALSVYGRDHQNQIETIRRLAQSLPLRWRLIVKEHPRSIGYRSQGYYQRLLEIPNVWFAAPEIRPFHWIERSQAVATISGFVGLEALMIGRPVLILGDVSYSMLPPTMLRKIGALSETSTQLEGLLASFRRDDNALKAFVAACMEESVAVNLYSDLLAKPGRNRMEEADVEQQYAALTELLCRRLPGLPAIMPESGAPAAVS